jgi:hypothetical protein
VKRLYAWLAGFAGGAAVYRVFRRRPRVAPPVAARDPADELKAKLAEARAGDEQASDPEPDTDVDSRRRSVHDRAREAIDEMHGSDPT